MATERSAAQGTRSVPSQEPGRLSPVAIVVAAGAAVLFSVVFSPLFTYASTIVGLNLGLGAIVGLAAIAGALLSLVAQLTG